MPELPKESDPCDHALVALDFNPKGQDLHPGQEVPMRTRCVLCGADTGVLQVSIGLATVGEDGIIDFGTASRAGTYIDQAQRAWWANAQRRRGMNK